MNLIEEMEGTETASPALWWLGHCGFAVKYQRMLFYIDPCLSRTRTLDPADVTNADLILCTHAHPGHMDPATLPAMLKASPRAKVVLPKSAAEHAAALGIPYERMTTTDSDLRVEYFKDGLYGRVYAVPSAHPDLNWTPIGGYPQLGYLVRFGACTIYHAGDCRMYDGIVDRLRPYNVTVALLPINGHGNFDVSEAGELAEKIGARWAVPMHCEASSTSRFIDHMLGFRPAVGFKVFQPGERWLIPISLQP